MTNDLPIRAAMRPRQWVLTRAEVRRLLRKGEG